LFSPFRLSPDLIFFPYQQFEALLDDEEIEEDYPSDWERYSPSYLEKNYSDDLDPKIYPRPVFNDQFSSHVDLGTVSTAVNSAANLTGRGTGKILSFPNWIQVFLLFFLSNLLVLTQTFFTSTK